MRIETSYTSAQTGGQETALSGRRLVVVHRVGSGPVNERRFDRRDERGVIAVMFALLLVVMLG